MRISGRAFFRFEGDVFQRYGVVGNGEQFRYHVGRYAFDRLFTGRIDGDEQHLVRQ